MKAKINTNVYLCLILLQREQLDLYEYTLLNIFNQHRFGTRLSNKFLADLLNISVRTLQRYLAKLEQKKLITINYKDMAKKEKGSRLILLTDDGKDIARWNIEDLPI